MPWFVLEIISGLGHTYVLECWAIKFTNRSLLEKNNVIVGIKVLLTLCLFILFFFNFSDATFDRLFCIYFISDDIFLYSLHLIFYLSLATRKYYIIHIYWSKNVGFIPSFSIILVFVCQTRCWYSCANYLLVDKPRLSTVMDSSQDMTLKLNICWLITVYVLSLSHWSFQILDPLFKDFPVTEILCPFTFFPHWKEGWIVVVLPWFHQLNRANLTCNLHSLHLWMRMRPCYGLWLFGLNHYRLRCNFEGCFFSLTCSFECLTHENQTSSNHWRVFLYFTQKRKGH